MCCSGSSDRPGGRSDLTNEFGHFEELPFFFTTTNIRTIGAQGIATRSKDATRGFWK